MCLSWRDSNCPGSDTMPPPPEQEGGFLRTPPSISIQLARRPPTEKGAGLGPQLLIMRTIVLAWYSSLSLSFLWRAHVCLSALGTQLERALSLRPGDSAEVCGEPNKEFLVALWPGTHNPYFASSAAATTLALAPTCLADPATQPLFPNQDPSAAVSRIFQQRWGPIKILPPLTM